MGNPVFADFVGDKSRQIRIGMQKPASRRDAVGNIGEFFRPEFIKFRYQRGLNQLGVDFGNAVDREGPTIDRFAIRIIWQSPSPETMETLASFSLVSPNFVSQIQ